MLQPFEAEQDIKNILKTEFLRVVFLENNSFIREVVFFSEKKENKVTPIILTNFWNVIKELACF